MGEMANTTIHFATDHIRRVRSDDSRAETSAVDLDDGIVNHFFAADFRRQC